MLYLFNFLRKKDLLLEVIHYILFRIKLICVITEIKREGLINGGYFFGYFTPDGKPSRGKLIINNNTFIGTFSESGKKKHGFLIKGDTIKKSDSLFKGFFDEDGNFVNGICYNFIKGTESIFETKITINKINKEINIKKEERRFVEVTENENNDILEKEVFQLSERGYTRYISNKNSIYVLTEANGRILISTEEHFNDGKIKKGKIIESNGDISEGTFNEEGRLEKGIIKKINGDIITRGSFNENYKIIEGIEFIKQENVGYHCNFDFSKNKMKTEKITEEKNDGDVFVGSIVDDGKIKYGQLTKKNGDRFEGFFDESGSFLEGVRHKEIGTKRYEDKIIINGKPVEITKKEKIEKIRYVYYKEVNEGKEYDNSFVDEKIIEGIEKKFGKVTEKFRFNELRTNSTLKRVFDGEDIDFIYALGTEDPQRQGYHYVAASIFTDINGELLVLHECDLNRKVSAEFVEFIEKCFGKGIKIINIDNQEFIQQGGLNTCGFHAIVNTRYGGPIDRIKYEIKKIPDYKEAEKEMQQRLGGNDKGIGI